MPPINNNNDGMVKWFTCVGLDIPYYQIDTDNQEKISDKTALPNKTNKNTSTSDFDGSEGRSHDNNLTKDEDFHSFTSHKTLQDNTGLQSTATSEDNIGGLNTTLKVDLDVNNIPLFFTPLPSPTSSYQGCIHPILDTYYDSSVLEKYCFPYDSPQQILPPYVELFCFPEGAKFLPVLSTAYKDEVHEIPQLPSPDAMQLLPSWHSFAVTDDQGKRTYVVALQMYKQLTKRERDYVRQICKEWRSNNMTKDEIEFCKSLKKKISEQCAEKQNLQELLLAKQQYIKTPDPDEGNLNLDNLFNDGTDSFERLQEQIFQIEDMVTLYTETLRERCNPGTFLDEYISNGIIRIYKPITWAIGSYHPFISLFKDWMHVVYHYHTERSSDTENINQPLAPEKWYLDQLNNLVVPPPGIYTISVPFLDSSMNLERMLWTYYSRPDALSFPMIGRPEYHVLLRRLDAEQIISILEWILAEHKLVLVSSDKNVLFTVSEILTRFMLYPFTWPHVYVPLLPKKLLSYLEAPVPYILGCLSTYSDSLWSTLSYIDRVLIVFLDERTTYYQDLGDELVHISQMEKIRTGHDYIQSIKRDTVSPTKARKKKGDKSISGCSPAHFIPPRQRRKLMHRLRKCVKIAKDVYLNDHVTRSSPCIGNPDLSDMCSAAMFNDPISDLNMIDEEERPTELLILSESEARICTAVTDTGISMDPAVANISIAEAEEIQRQEDDEHDTIHQHERKSSKWGLGRLLYKHGDYELLESDEKCEFSNGVSIIKPHSVGTVQLTIASEILLRADQDDIEGKASSFQSSSMLQWDPRKSSTILSGQLIDSSSVDDIGSSVSTETGISGTKLSEEAKETIDTQNNVLGHCFIEPRNSLDCEQCIYCPANINASDRSKLLKCGKCNILVHKSCRKMVFRPCNQKTINLDMATQASFTKVFTNIFQPYKRFITEPIIDIEIWKQRPEMFQRKDFVNHIPKECRQWTDQFLDSQIFTQFITDYFITPGQLSMESADANRKTIHMVHFDAMIQEKLNRSKWQSLKSKLKIKGTSSSVINGNMRESMHKISFPICIKESTDHKALFSVNSENFPPSRIRYRSSDVTRHCYAVLINDVDVRLHYQLVSTWNEYLEHRPKFIQTQVQDYEHSGRRQRPQESYWISQALKQQNPSHDLLVHRDLLPDIAKRVEESYLDLFSFLKEGIWTISLGECSHEIDVPKLTEYHNLFQAHDSNIKHNQQHSRVPIFFYLSKLVKESLASISYYMSK